VFGPEDGSLKREVFGPEDGSLNRAVLARCHRFVVIPTTHCTTTHCTNLAAAVYTVLSDRHAKRVRAGLETPTAAGADVEGPA
jgi:tRNA(Leu) C34 or U34 (ribose-2'-O)-methylase TrmL